MKTSIADALARQVLDADEALTFVVDAYRNRLLRPERSVEHPIAVARLLADVHQPQRLVIAGLLHDVLEDTRTTANELGNTFGPEAARLVQALTEDPSITKYKRRKAALRQQILAAGPDAGTVSLGDKLAKLSAHQSPPRPRKLAHYRQTLEGVEGRYGPSRLSGLLRDELARWPDT